MSEQVVNFFSHSVPSIIVRLSNIYGYTKLKRPDLIPTIMQDIFEKTLLFGRTNQKGFYFVEEQQMQFWKLLKVIFVVQLI